MRCDDGGAPELQHYTKAATYGNAIYRWDPVTLLAGLLKGPASGIAPGTTRYLGVAMEASLPSTLKELLVMVSSKAVYDCQEDNSGAANLVAADGLHANLTTTAGDSTLLTSKVQVSGTSINTTSSLDVNVLRLVEDPTNAYGAYARLEVRFNKHLLNKEGSVT